MSNCIGVIKVRFGTGVGIGIEVGVRLGVGDGAGEAAGAGSDALWFLNCFLIRLIFS